MKSISQYMSGDHKHCDELFVIAERCAADGQWAETAAGYAAFHQAMEQHFAMEEEVLFPALENAAGGAMGPTQVMRMEHRQMRELFAQLQQAAEAQQFDDFLGAAETLLILMQQHNIKEEQILYPMSDRLLAAETPVIIQQMQAQHVADGAR